ncbi:MAG: hypothetical protein A2431_01365 [Candidatus Zambryskibacteria bacterium RIFOXYC1_FULL_39_10]|uniref:Uncharacterized protein n=1 Tax=Candidatus Zambryskibacteria bacterium RIFOXYC1_FULL_39_10 TaxID=1802779 RepID=A0A1G2V3Z5_9BACT|nr:MAG: hypothetical protein A2431_01365 [Candidatus Zambryskibacteria bacterium RIFOXYC1_FULL_39_10]
MIVIRRKEFFVADRDPRLDPQIGGDVVGDRTIMERQHRYVNNREIEVVEWRKVRKEAEKWKGENRYGKMCLKSWCRWAKDKPVLRVATDEEIQEEALRRIGLGKNPIHITRYSPPLRAISTRGFTRSSGGDYHGSCHPGSGNAF